MKFSFSKLSKPLLTVISELGYKEPTEIQSITIPILLEDDTDFVGQAQTGTGKTAAFCLPLLEKLKFNKKNIQAIILSPTRELASQINQDLLRFARYLPVKTAIVYGGVGYRDQLRDLRDAHIVVATPGRAIDLLKKGKLNINDCKF
ncbi:MAG: DEAD/DEAH box helicase, partial [Halobacteriovoraceae bacterium]|nr:DEAD/DEAH box helicase [Halobacteriovoraceae bacterium]